MDCLLNFLNHYLSGYEPGEVIDGILQKGSFLRSTDQISRDLSDMIDVDDNEIVDCLFNLGYKVVYLSNGRHGWLLKNRMI